MAQVGKHSFCFLPSYHDLYMGTLDLSEKIAINGKQSVGKEFYRHSTCHEHLPGVQQSRKIFTNRLLIYWQMGADNFIVFFRQILYFGRWGSPPCRPPGGYTLVHVHLVAAPLHLYPLARLACFAASSCQNPRGYALPSSVVRETGVFSCHRNLILSTPISDRP